MLEDWGVLPVLKASHFCCPDPRLQGTQRPCSPPSRQGSILLSALVRPPGIIVAIGLTRRGVRPKRATWPLIVRRNGRKNYFCGVSVDPESPIIDADFSRGCASEKIGHALLAIHPLPLIRELTLGDAVTKVNGVDNMIAAPFTRSGMP